jgi:hypothetical protein
MSDKTDTNPSKFSEQTNTYLTEYVKFADAKAGGIMTVTSAIGAVVAATSERVFAAARNVAPWVNTLGILVAALLAVAVVATLWFTIEALSPKTPAAGASLHSFPDIASMESATFVEKIVALTAAETTQHYALHNHTLANVAKEKFASVGNAIQCLRITLIAACVLAVIYAYSAASDKTSEPSKTQSSVGTTVVTVV